MAVRRHNWSKVCTSILALERPAVGNRSAASRPCGHVNPSEQLGGPADGDFVGVPDNFKAERAQVAFTVLLGVDGQVGVRPIPVLDGSVGFDHDAFGRKKMINRYIRAPARIQTFDNGASRRPARKAMRPSDSSGLSERPSLCSTTQRAV